MASGMSVISIIVVYKIIHKKYDYMYTSKNLKDEYEALNFTVNRLVLTPMKQEMFYMFEPQSITIGFCYHFSNALKCVP